MQFTELTNEEYHGFIKETHESSSYLQTLENKNHREITGREVRLLGVKDNDGNVVAAGLFTLQPTTLGHYLFYSNKGPVLDYHNHGLVRFYMQELTKYLKKNKCSHVKIDPNWLYMKYDKDVNEKESFKKQDDLIKVLESEGFNHEGFEIGFSRTSQPRWISVLDLSQYESEKDLIKSFDSQRKRNVKKAQKYGIKVKFLESDELDKFINMYIETSERKDFFIQKDPKQYFSDFKAGFTDKMIVPLAYIDLKEYLERMNQESVKAQNELNKLETKEIKNDKTLNKIEQLKQQINKLDKDIEEANTIRKKEGDILNLASGVFYETPYELVYHSGASTSDYQQFVGPYMMHIEMMKYAMEKEIDRYNFFGVTGDFSENAEDYGVYLFKRGFNAELEEYLGDFVKVINPSVHFAYKVIRKFFVKGNSSF